MNSRNVPLLLVLALAIAIGFHHQKADDSLTEIGRIEKGLKGVGDIIGPSARLSFKGEPGKQELFFWARYVLAPSCVLHQTPRADTVLSIQFLHGGDSTLSDYLARRKIVFQTSDDLYRYLITTKE